MFPVTKIDLIFMTVLLLLRHWSRHISVGAALEAEWNKKFAEYEKKYKEEAAELKSVITGELPAGWEKALPVSTALIILIAFDYIFEGILSIFCLHCLF